MVKQVFIDGEAFASHQARAGASPWGQLTQGFAREYQTSGLDLSASADETFMHQALQLADHASKAGEVPVGAVLVRDGQVMVMRLVHDESRLRCRMCRRWWAVWPATTGAPARASPSSSSGTSASTGAMRAAAGAASSVSAGISDSISALCTNTQPLLSTLNVTRTS